MTPRRIVLVGWGLFMLACYPGFLKHDGASMLVDSRSGEFTDAHSPMMTQVWRIVGVLFSGPAGMLALQSLMLVFALYALLARCLAPRAAALAAAVMLIVPPIFATTALISPEAQLASFLLAGTIALADPRRTLRIVGIGLMVIACGMRDGAAVAALPIIVLTFRWRDEVAGWRRYALATGAWLAIALVAAGLNWLMIDDDYDRGEVALAMSDIVGTFSYARDTSDAELRTLLGDVSVAAETGIQSRARDVYGKPLEYAGTARSVFETPETMPQRAALIVARRAVIRAMPGAYLRHRAHQFAKVLGFSSRWSTLYTQFVATQSQIDALQHAARSSYVQQLLQVPLRWFSRTFLFRPYVYFVLGVVLLVVAIIRRHRDASMLIGSGVLHELSLMFVATRHEFRDSHWMIVATVLGGVLLAAQFRASRAKLQNRGTNASTTRQ